jgi:hypothetical protein
MGNVVDPAGVAWRVSRRWYPWRRHFSLRDFLTTEQPPAPVADAAPEPVAEPASKPDLPKNVVLKILFLLVGVVVWIVMGLGKVLFYTGAVVLVLLLSLVEWVLALVIMPITLVLRLVGMARWPVEIGRGGKPFATEYAGDYGGAGALRDRLSADIAAGAPPPAPPEPAA